MENLVENSDTETKKNESYKNKHRLEMVLVLGALALDNQEISENPGLAWAVETDNIDIVIKAEDLEKPKLCIGNKVRYPGKRWIAVTATPFYIPNTNFILGGAWQEKANCIGYGKETFFLVGGKEYYGPKGQLAYDICQNCPVRVECLESALFYEDKNGIWAGFNAMILNKLSRGRMRLYKDRLSEKHLAVRLENLNLSSATLGVLAKRGIHTVGKLSSLPNRMLRKLRSSTNIMVEEYREKLLELALIEAEDLDENLSKQKPAPCNKEVREIYSRNAPQRSNEATYRFEPYNDLGDTLDKY